MINLGSGGVVNNATQTNNLGDIKLVANQSWSGSGNQTVGILTTSGSNLNLTGTGTTTIHQGVQTLAPAGACP